MFLRYCGISYTLLLVGGLPYYRNLFLPILRHIVIPVYEIPYYRKSWIPMIFCYPNLDPHFWYGSRTAKITGSGSISLPVYRSYLFTVRYIGYTSILESRYTVGNPNFTIQSQWRGTSELFRCTEPNRGRKPILIVYQERFQ